jgi:hypothetical protein
MPDRDMEPAESWGPFEIGENYVTLIDENRPPTDEELQELLDRGIRMKDKSTWVIIDTLVIADKYLGDDMWNLLFGHLEHGTILNYRWIGNTWPKEWRVPDVPPSFHQEMCAMFSEARRNGDQQGMIKARQWLIDARDLGMGKKEMVFDRNNNSEPPSMRFENNLDALSPLDLIVEMPDAPYVRAIKKAESLRDWLKKNGEPEQVNEMKEIIRVLRSGAKLAAKYVR